MVYGFDLETTGLDPFAPGAAIVCGTLGGNTWSGPISDAALAEFRRPGSTLVGHNLAFDLAWMYCETPKALFCTMVAQHLLDENVPNSLEATAQRWLHVGKKEHKGWELSEALLDYNRHDAHLAERLYTPMYLALSKQGLMPLFRDQMDVLRVLVRMRRRGVLVDWDRLAKIASDGASDAANALAKIEALVPGLNPRSGKQIEDYLFAEGRLPVRVRTPKGKPATNRQALVLAKLMDADMQDADLLDAILAHRKLDKMSTGFLSTLPNHRGWDDRIHTQFHLGRGGKGPKQNGTVSGRLSSSDPNLQNLPKRDKLVRSCLIPTRGLSFLKADYSQIELRIAAWLSEDPSMRGIFARDEDFHTATLAKMERVPYPVAVSNVANGTWSAKRDACKRVNFGAIYGAYPKTIWANAIADGFDVTPREIEKIWHEQKKVFAHFWAWAEEVARRASVEGEVISPFGVHRRFPPLTSADGHANISRMERQAINHLVQSSAASIMLMGLRGVETSLGNVGTLLLTVHDEVLVEYLPALEKEAKDAVHEGMYDYPMRKMQAMGLPDLQHLNPKVEISAGLQRWAEA
jgi:DNA polymerase-1